MVSVAYYVANCMMSQWEYLHNNRTDHKIPFQGSRAYILLLYLFILEWKTMNYWFSYDYYFSAQTKIKGVFTGIQLESKTYDIKL